VGRRLVKFWNFLTKVRRPHCDPENLLLLLPVCMQRGGCPQDVVQDINECELCGQCPVKDMVELSRKYGTQCAMATGGRLALELAERDSVEVIVAVACEKELQEGLKGVFPKPALGIINIRPNGPCRDTQVDVEEVEETIQKIIGEE
jgi:hypothetical protein